MNGYDDSETVHPYETPPRFTVTELTREIRRILEDGFPLVAVEGEISNYVHHSSGHRYFSLKDDVCQIRCVMFKGMARGLGCVPEDGLQVVAIGTISVYERGGQYQLTVQRLLPRGRGELLARLEELKRSLATEGVFANARPLPAWPATVAVVTSPTGAAVRDIISVITRRAPHVRIVLRPTLVQGPDAAADIARAIAEVNEHTDADVLIVGRGGGSIEDLWCFNEEAVARAVHASRIPVIAAVGHETDVTLTDFAADLRAPTPSAAAELAVPDAAAMRSRIESHRARLAGMLTSALAGLSHRVESVRRGLQPERMLRRVLMRHQEVDELVLRMKSAGAAALAGREKRLERLAGTLAALDPHRVLDRGYAVVRRADGAVVTDAGMVAAGEDIGVTVAKGGFRARVTATEA